jgi:hypothetical protein
MKTTLLALGLTAAMMPFAFAQAPATNSGTNASQSTTNTKKVKKTNKKAKKNSGTTTNSAAPSK